MNRYLMITGFLLVSLIVPFNIWAASPEDPVVAIGDITRIEGIRDNQLMGYGIVIGLAGTGDTNRSQATIQSVANMLENYGIKVFPDQVRSRNLAAVIVTATLPPFAHPGDRIDVTVSSLGDAQSLQGGTLLMAPLKAANGDIYAVAQGPISIGGFNSQQGGSQVRQNHPTVGRIPGGALVERALNININQDSLTYLLDNPNFETASFIAQAINNNFMYLPGNENIARAVDAGKVIVNVPTQYSDNVVDFIAKVNNFQVRSSMEAKVVINERTGTIVIGHNVRISTVSVAHGNLTVRVSTDQQVSQPDPFSGGETVTTTETTIEVEEEESHLMVVPNQGTISDLVTALNTIGATPRDIIAIIQQIKAAGALHAELELI